MGIGGIVGIYLGARRQGRVPSRWIKAMLAATILFLSIRYVIQYLA
jgi:uncharacterized membrane protein YfcA